MMSPLARIIGSSSEATFWPGRSFWYVDIADARRSPAAAASVTALYAEHALGLVRLAVVMTGDRAAAEDIVQDAFLGLYRRWDRLADMTAPLAYLRVSVVNGCRTALRRRSRLGLWPVAGPVSGDLTAVSKVVWSVQDDFGKNHGLPTAVQQCVAPVVGMPVLISADGKTFSCTTAGGRGQVDHLSFHTYPLAASTTATTRGTTDYDVSYTSKGRYLPEVLWTSASGGTLIGALFPVDGGSPAAVYPPRIGVISHGKFTPLRLAASLSAGRATGGDPVIAIAF